LPKTEENLPFWRASHDPWADDGGGHGSRANREACGIMATMSGIAFWKGMHDSDERAQGCGDSNEDWDVGEGGY
jgi:hypothetical protein